MEKNIEKKRAENVVVNYFRTAFEELTKITWPTKNQAMRLTAVVLSFCVISALALGVLDYVLSKLFEYLLTIAV